MYKLVFALLAALVLPVLAYAQEDAEPAADPAPVESASAVRYVNQSFGKFSLDMPSHGTMETPATEGWDAEEQVVFNWFGAEDDPVVLIQCRVDSFEAELESSAYDIFCDTLLSNWLTDEDNYTVIDPPRPAMEGQPRRTRNMIGTHEWNLIQIEDRSDANGGKIYYSILTTWMGSDIYTISFYYLNPMTKDDSSVKDFGRPLLESFRIAGEPSMPDSADGEMAEDAA